MKIRRDERGLYGHVGGWVARPCGGSRFTEGQNVKAAHFGGSTIIGVGKDETCRRGEYLELWGTAGLSSDYAGRE